MKISIISQSGDVLDNQVSNTSPLSHFMQKLASFDYEFGPLDDSTEAVVSMNVHPSAFGKEFERIPRSRRVLIIWEPRVTRPSNFSRKYREKFGMILCPSPNWRLSFDERSETFNWPQGAIKRVKSDLEWSKRGNKLALFQSNKFSLIEGQNYSLRRVSIKKEQDSLVVFGKGWNNPKESMRELFVALLKALIFEHRIHIAGLTSPFIKIINYLGYVENKDEALATFKFTLVIENSSDYVSEKLFEAIRVGSIPLYVGPSLDKFGIPIDIAIACEPNPESIFKEYHKIRSDFERQSYIRKKGSEFMTSKTFVKHMNTNVFSDLASQVHNILSQEPRKK